MDTPETTVPPEQQARARAGRPSRSSRIDLTNRIVASLKSTDFAGEFLPHSCIAEIITPTTIRAAFPLIKPESAEYICKNATKVFATMVLSNPDDDITAEIEGLIRHEFTDEVFPIEIKKPRQLDEDTSCSHKSPGACLRSSGWPEHAISIFCNEQWKCLAPVFKNDGGVQHVSSRCPLPMIKADLHRLGYPFNLYKVQIHEDHQDILPVWLS